MVFSRAFARLHYHDERRDRNSTSRPENFSYVVNYANDATSHTSNHRVDSTVCPQHNCRRRLRCALRRKHHQNVLGANQRVLRLRTNEGIMLRGGFGTPDEGYTLVWKNFNLSKQRLRHSETVAELERLLAAAHPSARTTLEERIADAKRGVGPTVFDWLVDADSD